MEIIIAKKGVSNLVGDNTCGIDTEIVGTYALLCPPPSKTTTISING